MTCPFRQHKFWFERAVLTRLATTRFRPWDCANTFCSGPCSLLQSRSVQIAFVAHCRNCLLDLTTKAFRLSRLYSTGPSPVHRTAGVGHCAFCTGVRWKLPLRAASLSSQLQHPAMAPKRQKEAPAKSPAKKAKNDAQPVGNGTKSDSHNKLIGSLLEDKLLGQTYCEELGIDITSGSNAVFQWLACSSMFGSRISEASRGTHQSICQTLIRSACMPVTFCMCTGVDCACCKRAFGKQAYDTTSNQ